MKRLSQMAAMATFVSLFLFSSTTLFAGVAAAETFSVHLRENKLTVKAEHAGLRALMQEIAHQGDISIHFHHSPQDTVSADLEEIPLKMGLKKLLKNYNHVLVYQADSDGQKEAITGIFVFSKTGQSDIKAVWHPENTKNRTPTFKISDNGILRHAHTPDDTDPMQGMQAIDPLARMIAPAETPPLPDHPLMIPLHEANLEPPGP